VSSALEETQSAPVQAAGLEHRAAAALSVAIVAVAAVAMYETLAAMMRSWSASDAHAHGWLIFPLFAYLVWRQRGALARMPMSPSVAGVVVLGGAVLLWFAGHLANTLVVQEVAFVTTIAAAIWAVCGTRCIRLLAFPCAFLVFAIPFGEAFVEPLMRWTAAATVGLLQLSGIAVYRDGMLFSTAVGDFEIARACSGIRYLTASAALGMFYGCLSLRTIRWRLAFLLLAIIAPILANAVRAYLIVALAHVSDMKIATGVDHIVYGWVFFGAVMFGLLYIGELLRRRERVAVTDGSGSADSVCASVPKLARVALICVALVISVRLLAARLDALPVDAAPTPAGLALAGAGWRGPLVAGDAWSPEFQGGATIERGRYQHDELGTVDTALVFYAREQQGAELIGDGNSLAAPSAWRRVSFGSTDLGELGTLRVERFDSARMPERLTIWSVYAFDGEALSSPYAVKLDEALARLRRVPQRAVLIAFAYRGPDEAAESVLKAFATEHLAAFLACTGGPGHQSSCRLPGS
jgi:exosortase A